MISREMNLISRQFGYTAGLSAPNINDNFIKIKEFLDSCDLNPDMSTVLKPSTLEKVKRQTSDFYSLVLNLHNVYIMPQEHEVIFDTYLKAANSNEKGFKELLNRYAVYASPFYIPLVQRNILPRSSSGADIIGYITNNLDVSKIPNINEAISVAPYSNFTFCYYAYAICCTQQDRIKGMITNYHDSEILGLLIEKIIAYEAGRNIFYYIQRSRLDNIKAIMNMINSDPKNNYLWTGLMSTIKAEELFDYYVSLSDNDKRDFFGCIQRLFDEEMSFNDFLNKTGTFFAHEPAIKAMSRNLSIK